MVGNNLLAKGRDYNIDLLKILACIAVVGLHTFQKDLSVLNAVLYYLCGFAVPMFFICSGVFLMNRKDTDLKYSVNKIRQILILVLSWGIIILVARCVGSIFSYGSPITLRIILRELVGGLVQKGTMWQFWYFGAIIIIYILLPLLTRTNRAQREILLVITGLIAIVLQGVSYVIGYPMQKYVCQTFRIWTWLFYFILGGFLYNQFRENFSNGKLRSE